MKTVILKRLEINNFKGIKEIYIDFTKITNIYGENALGKTSIFDAFTWLLFDKDSKNRSSFEIKPLDNNNNVIRELNPCVQAILEINNKELKLSKTLEEKWTKKRGESERTFTGNVTTYEIDDIPVKLSDYKKKISEIADEEQFKLLTNPYYFSEALNWKEARRIILEVSGDVSVEQVINYNKDLEPIRSYLEKDNVDIILKSKKASMKKLADRKKEIPTRINELDRSIVFTDFTEIEDKLEQNKALLNVIDEELIDSSKSSEVILENKNKIFILKDKIQEIEQKAKNEFNSKRFEITSKLKDLEYKLNTVNLNIKMSNNDIENKEKEMKKLSDEVVELREKFNAKNAEQVDLSNIEQECPTCKRTFDESDMYDKKVQIVENYNANKAAELKEIRDKGVNKNKEIETLSELLSTQRNTLSKLEKERDSLNNEVSEIKTTLENYECNTELKFSLIDKENVEKYKIKINELENYISIQPGSNTDDLISKKKDINNTLDMLRKELAKKELNVDLQNRRNTLLDEEKDLGIEIARQERIVMLCETFIKTRVDLLESNINSKFKNVSFKLFKEQVNGGIDETCEALVNGIPFSNANTAGQINAGLDIINTLSDHFDIQVPVFIDNKESVNNLIEIDSQVINLVVTRDNPLKIENLQTEGVM